MSTAPAAPAKAAEPAAPHWRSAMLANWRTHSIQGLALLIIWGALAFVWGSLDSWARHRATTQLEGALRSATPLVERWLTAPLEPLKPLTKDAVLMEALASPLGIAHPAVQRLLNQRTANGMPDIILTDLAVGRTVTAPGSTPPPSEVFETLRTLMRGNEATVVATGTRNGMLYYVMPLPGGVGQRNAALTPIAMRQMASDWPVIDEDAGMDFEIRLPHTNGMAQWADTAPLRLQVPPLLPANAFAERDSIFAELTGVSFHGQLIGKPPLASGTTKLFLLLWAIAASLWVVWPTTAPLRARLAPIIGPKLAPFAKYGRAAVPLFNTILNTINGGITSVAKSLAALTKGSSEPIDDELSWRSNSREEALVGGPGNFSASDFRSQAAARAAMAAGKLKPRALAPQNRPDPAHGGRTDSPAPSRSASDSTAHDDPFLQASEEEAAALKLTDRVKRCLAEGRLELLYQPMYRCDDGSPFANEVLARMKDEEGVIAPGQFLPILTQMRQVATLDALVFEKVLNEHFMANALVMKSPSTSISLNISGNSLEDLGYLRDVAKQGTEVLRHFIFEVRSNEVVRDPNAIQLLKALQRQGAKVAIDYFGGGGTMIEASKAIGLDYVKLDAMRLGSNRSSKKEFIEICIVAGKVGMPVIVERVEDRMTESFARRAGASFVQGYGLCRPGPNLATLSLQSRLSQE